MQNQFIFEPSPLAVEDGSYNYAGAARSARTQQALGGTRRGRSANGRALLGTGEGENEADFESGQNRLPLYRAAPGRIISLSNRCSSPALQAIPLLDPKVVSCLTVEVPAGRVKWLLNHSLLERGPNWVKQLRVDVTKKIPKVTVTIELFRCIAVRPDDPRVVREFGTYLAAKGLKYYSAFVTELNLRKRIQSELGISLEALYRQGGALGPLPVDEYRRFVVFVYATFPDSVKQYLRPIGNYMLDKFEFNKADLRDFHRSSIETIARDIVDSWWTSKKVVGIRLRGHTDERGTLDYNYRLGERRATAVRQRLREALSKFAPTAMLSSLDRIRVNVGSIGKDEPVSKTDHARNRRVEVIFEFARPAPSRPLTPSQVAERSLKILQAQRTLDKNVAQRLICLMDKMKSPAFDDRYMSTHLVSETDRTGRPTGPHEWPRLRYSLIVPDFFGPAVSDGQVLKNLEKLDEQVMEGIMFLRRRINYYSGVPVVGALSTVKAFRALDAWFQRQLGNENSVYRCYRGV